MRLSYLFRAKEAFLKPPVPPPHVDNRVVAMRDLIQNLKADLAQARENLEKLSVDDLIKLRFALNVANYIEKRLSFYTYIYDHVEDDEDLFDQIEDRIEKYEEYLLKLHFSSEAYSYSEQIKLQHEINICTDKHYKHVLQIVLKLYNIYIAFTELDVKCIHVSLFNVVNKTDMQADVISKVLNYKLLHIKWLESLRAVISLMDRIADTRDILADDSTSADSVSWHKCSLASDLYTLLEFELQAYLNECQVKNAMSKEVLSGEIESKYEELLAKCTSFYVDFYYAVDEATNKKIPRHEFEIDRDLLHEIHAVLMEIKEPALENFEYILSQLRPITYSKPKLTQ